MCVSRGIPVIRLTLRIVAREMSWQKSCTKKSSQRRTWGSKVTASSQHEQISERLGASVLRSRRLENVVVTRWRSSRPLETGSYAKPRQSSDEENDLMVDDWSSDGDVTSECKLRRVSAKGKPRALSYRREQTNRSLLVHDRTHTRVSTFRAWNMFRYFAGAWWISQVSGDSPGFRNIWRWRIEGGKSSTPIAEDFGPLKWHTNSYSYYQDDSNEQDFCKYFTFSYNFSPAGKVDQFSTRSRDRISNLFARKEENA